MSFPDTTNTPRPCAPAREDVEPLSESGLIPAPGLKALCADPYELAARYKISGGKSKAVLLATATATIGGLLFGVDQGLVSIILVSPQFLAVFPQIDTNPSAKGILTAMLELGAVLGALQSGFLSDKFSRKYTLLVGVIWFTIGGILQTTAFSLAQLIVGRSIAGVGIGILSSVAPTYVAEISPPHLRGRLLVLEEFMIVFGIVVAYYTTYGTRLIQSEWSFRLPFLLQIVPGFFLGVMVFYLPFSPRWLAIQGRDEEALESLIRLRELPSSDVRVQAEWVVIRAEAIRCQETSRARHPHLQGSDWISQLKLEIMSWRDCFSPNVIRRTHIGIGLMLFQQLVGINAIVYFSPTLFASLGFNLETTLILAGVANVFQLIAVTFALFTIDKVGRRPPLLIGSVGMAACLFIVAIFISQFSADWEVHQAAARAGVALLFCYMLFFGVGWGPNPWSIPSELNSLSFRAKGVAIATVTNWSGNFVVGLITPVMFEKIPYGTFIFFGSFSVLSGIWVYCFVPETRARSLEQIDGLFKSNSAAEDEHQKDDIVSLILASSKAGSLRIDDSVHKVEKIQY